MFHLSVLLFQYLSCLSTQSSSSDKLAFDVGLTETSEGMAVLLVAQQLRQTCHCVYDNNYMAWQFV